nr:hypothetical protein CFP56_75960 [Quercus suber]POE84141.1 hypothetical protein CFP56_40016 [Quercus suber]
MANEGRDEERSVGLQKEDPFLNLKHRRNRRWAPSAAGGSRHSGRAEQNCPRHENQASHGEAWTDCTNAGPGPRPVKPSQPLHVGTGQTRATVGAKGYPLVTPGETML